MSKIMMRLYYDNWRLFTLYKNPVFYKDEAYGNTMPFGMEKV